MGRHSKKQAIPASELLNFHFSTPVTSEISGGRSQGQFPRNNRRQTTQPCHRTAQDRASARRRANSANFYLHSSPDHSFALTRRSSSKIQGGSAYTFSGCDSPVAWESVRVVKHSIPIDTRSDSEEIACPICLSVYLCARVTKCGHSFCLPCLLRHVQSYSASNPYKEVKCPCCSISLLVEDLRPVIIQKTIPPIAQNVMRLRKLHRQNGCPAPYLPLQDAPKHSSAHTAPCQCDDDAIFSRFNYVDPLLFRCLLEENRITLLQEMESTPSESTDYLFLSMALEIVSNQLKEANEEYEGEAAIQRRFASVACGMYQKQSPLLVYNPGRTKSDNVAAHGILSHEAPSMKNLDAIFSDSGLTLHGRQRGESIGSQKSVESVSNSHQSSSDHCKTSEAEHFHVKPGTMYAEDETVHFYQAEDGQLVFLSGFNMVCLCADFSKTRPIGDTQDKPPLPDYVSGRILDVRNVDLTPDIRKRFAFLEHLPLYTNISFVELDLGHIMSREAKRKFQPELAKRRKLRQNKVKAEKRADSIARQKEARLVSERKARLNVIDPNDEFFHTSAPEEAGNVPVQPSETDPEVGDVNSLLRPQSNKTPRQIGPAAQSFSDACRKGANRLILESEESFPVLQSSFPALPAPTVRKPAPNLKGWAAEKKDAAGNLEAVTKHEGKKKATKGEKVVLFSTGGQRGYGF